jgi:hypothetical protein
MIGISFAAWRDGRRGAYWPIGNMGRSHSKFVIAGLDPAIHHIEEIDARITSGHDIRRSLRWRNMVRRSAILLVLSLPIMTINQSY